MKIEVYLVHVRTHRRASGRQLPHFDASTTNRLGACGSAEMPWLFRWWATKKCLLLHLLIKTIHIYRKLLASAKTIMRKLLINSGDKWQYWLSFWQGYKQPQVLIQMADFKTRPQQPAIIAVSLGSTSLQNLYIFDLNDPEKEEIVWIFLN